MLRDWLTKRRDKFAASLLWSALMLGIHSDDPPPAWMNDLLRRAPEGVLLEFWEQCCEAGIAQPAYEVVDPRWSSFEGVYYLMWRRASGRTLPFSEDWLFGWREMHPDPDSEP